MHFRCVLSNYVQIKNKYCIDIYNAIKHISSCNKKSEIDKLLMWFIFCLILIYRHLANKCLHPVCNTLGCETVKLSDQLLSFIVNRLYTLKWKSTKSWKPHIHCIFCLQLTNAWSWYAVPWAEKQFSCRISCSLLLSVSCTTIVAIPRPFSCHCLLSFKRWVFPI